MKRVFFFVCGVLMLCVAAAAQESKVILTGDTMKVAPVRVYGFVRNYYTFDSRQTYTVVGGEYHLLPYDEDLHDGVDLNAVPSGQLQALSSRFGLDVTGPVLLGMRSSAKLEGDFGGFGSYNHELRLRLAYLKLQTLNTELLIGQDWHPLSGNIMPEVLGMAAGAPFRPHSRTPQIRGTLYWGSFGYSAALLWQLQYMNNGPKSATNPATEASVSYAHNALWPEAYLDFGFRNSSFIIKLGVDAQILSPRTHASVDGVTKKVDETVKSITPTVYAQYVEGMWSVKFRTLLAQNTSHLNQLVGYAVTGVNEDGSWSYSPMNATISYLNIAYGKTYRADLFLGYMQNLGVGENLLQFTDNAGNDFYRIYMKGGETFTHLHSVWRVAPSLSYNVKAFNVGLEYEVTGVRYGDLNSDATVEPQRHIINHRLCALVKYNF
ncbi:MAG: hypothetical protein IK058_05695 [Bacteroidales bacterium]|nr:hypothetical protein [Bacteroidales bacterium]